MRRCSILALALVLWPPAVLAGTPQHSLQYLTTGNGFGFQVFDASQWRIKQFLERPYRHLNAPSDPKADGPIRRNIAFDVYFGVIAGGDHGWLPSSDSDVSYVEETNVIRSTGQLGAIKTESYFFAPFGYDGNAMVMLLKVTNTGGSPVNVDGAALFNFHMGSGGGDNPGSESESVTYDSSSGAGVETGPGGGAMIYVGIGGVDRASCSSNAYNELKGGSSITPQLSCSGNDLPEAFQKSIGTLAAGASGWWGAALLYEASGAGAKTAALARWNTFLGSRTPETLLQGVLDEWKSWRKAIPAGATKDSKENAIWRQSEAVLRMGQIREPWSESPKLKNFGMVLASLPPGGWHTGWVRDAQYAIVALARLGHCAEAKAALEFFLNAEAGPTNSAVPGGYKSFLKDKSTDYRISVVRYFGNGVEEADYSGQQTPNVEIDGWGMYLWSVRIYLDACHDDAWLTGKTKYGETIYDVINGKVAGALEKNLDAIGSNFVATLDTSIWEVHMGSAQHFFYTSAAAARGFCDMATIAVRASKPTDATHYKDLSKKVVDGIQATMVDKNKVLAGSMERLTSGQYIDGATVEAVTWDLGLDSAINSATLNAMNNLHTVLGGYKRVEGSTEPYDTNEWILLDLRVSDAWRRLKQPAVADQLLGWVTGQAALNYNLLPELYDVTKNGNYAGSIPMVGYGAGAYVISLLERAGYMAATECGAAPVKPTEAGPVRIDYGPPAEFSVVVGEPTTSGGTEATGFACLCTLDGLPSGWTLGAVALLALLVLLTWSLRRKR
jgi:GH15 family glucan-1,4-alpha-glucosidase